jgi:hypothetical protein
LRSREKGYTFFGKEKKPRLRVKPGLFNFDFLIPQQMEDVAHAYLPQGANGKVQQTNC